MPTNPNIPEPPPQPNQEELNLAVYLRPEDERSMVRRLAWNLISACDRLLLTCEGTEEDRMDVNNAKYALRLALFGPMRVGRDVEEVKHGE